MKYEKVVSGNGIAHILDLLVEDLNKQPWLVNIFDAVSKINSIFHPHRKLKCLFEEQSAVWDGLNSIFHIQNVCSIETGCSI